MKKIYFCRFALLQILRLIPLHQSPIVTLILPPIPSRKNDAENNANYILFLLPFQQKFQLGCINKSC